MERIYENAICKQQKYKLQRVTRIHTHTPTHINMNTYSHTYICTRTHALIHTHTRTHMSTRTYSPHRSFSPPSRSLAHPRSSHARSEGSSRQCRDAREHRLAYCPQGDNLNDGKSALF